MGNDDKYIKLIETTLLNLVKKVDAIDDKISLIDRQVGQLWIKSSIFGTLGGFLSMCIYIVINVYSK